MLLAVDVGNTQTHLGVYKGTELVEHWRFATARHATADQLAIEVAALLRLRGATLRRRGGRDRLLGRARRSPRSTSS